MRKGGSVDKTPEESTEEAEAQQGECRSREEMQAAGEEKQRRENSRRLSLAPPWTTKTHNALQGITNTRQKTSPSTHPHPARSPPPS
jgi:hypothetical protein